MLFARKERLCRRYELRVIWLAERLLHHYLSNAEKLATLCAIFLGFAADQLLDSAADIDAGTHKVSSVGRLASMSLPFLSVACIGASIFCCWGCMLLSLFSSHAALQGPQSDYCNVVDKVEEEFDFLWRCMLASAYLFGFLGLAWGLANLRLIPSIILGVSITLSIVLFNLSDRVIAERFGVLRQEIERVHLDSSAFEEEESLGSPPSPSRAHDAVLAGAERKHGLSSRASWFSHRKLSQQLGGPAGRLLRIGKRKNVFGLARYRPLSHESSRVHDERRSLMLMQRWRHCCVRVRAATREEARRTANLMQRFMRSKAAAMRNLKSLSDVILAENENAVIVRTPTGGYKVTRSTRDDEGKILRTPTGGFRVLL